MPTIPPCATNEECKADATPLRKGISALPFSGAQGEKRYFVFAVPSSATNLAVTTSNGSGDADLYVKLGDIPTETDYDCRPFQPGNDEMCDIQDAKEGSYYIMIIGKEDYSNLSLMADYNQGTTGGGNGGTAGDCQPTAVQKELLDAHNEARAQGRNCGNQFFDAVPPLTWSCKLGEAAQAHSDDMATQNYFDHTGKDGSSPGDRIDRTGYQSRGWGENIAAGQRDTNSVMSGWLDSPGHCSNIMTRNLTELGAAKGESSNSQYRFYWTAVFAKPAQ